MWKRLVGISLVFFSLCAAWLALAGSVSHRTYRSDSALHEEVSGLWGSQQSQSSPGIVFTRPVVRRVQESVTDSETGVERVVVREEESTEREPMLLDSSNLAVDFRLDQRRKGLLWYSTYEVDFVGDYAYVHEEAHPGCIELTFRFPSAFASYDGFAFEVNGEGDDKLALTTVGALNTATRHVDVEPGDRVEFSIRYRSRGLDWWRYAFGESVSRVNDFRLIMTTDFDAIDFPEGTISPSIKEPTGNGWELTWEFDSLVSGFQVGMEMPRRLNPGPLAAQMSLFAPISLGFFFVWMFVITLLERIDLHPLNYLFLGAAFFSFHLLFAYTVDHISVTSAFVLSSAVSLFLVISYLRLVVGMRFAAVEAGASQFIYLVLFSYAHFFEGFTGLVITIGSIVTLFALMQLTGRIRWSHLSFDGQAALEKS